MGNLAEWIRRKLGNARRGSAQPLGALELLDSTIAERANHGSRAPTHGTERSIVHDGAELPGPELAATHRRNGDILAIVCHELRSPLASLHYAIRVLSSQTGETATRQQMQALIARQVNRMTHLVDDLVDVSRIAHGQLHLQRERIDLRVIVSNAIETVEPELNERQQQLAAELPAVPVWLQADPGRLEQVFVNLLANASRYTNAGGTLAVRAHTKSDDAVVRIRDSGIGIAPDALPHIFELFMQAHEGGRRSGAGLGVGLAVVRNLVELHGGSVSAASAGSGQGSEFTVRLPTTDGSERRRSHLAAASSDIT